MEKPSPPTPKLADVARILRRAGIDYEARWVLVGSLPQDQIVRAFVVDALREEERWTRRVKLVESRTDFAISALRGGHDDGL